MAGLGALVDLVESREVLAVRLTIKCDSIVLRLMLM